jgi:hypothetical protein
VHKFIKGWCQVPGCPHVEKRLSKHQEGATTAKRDRVHRCNSKGCPNVGTVRFRRDAVHVYYLCRGCAERKQARDAAA